MKIELRLTERCNYNCEYCTSMHNNKSNDTKFDYIAFESLVNNFELVDIFVYGGEPTVNAEFREIIDWMVSIDKIKSITIQTNASKGRLLHFDNDKVLINISYHKGVVSFAKFIKQIKNLKINEIAYMDYDDDYEDYKMLKKIYGDKIQFCPLIDGDISKESSTERLVALRGKKIFKEISGDYHFTKMGVGGKSNYDYWATNTNKPRGKGCLIRTKTVHVQDNMLYECFNDIFNPDIKGIPIINYKKRNQKDVKICKNKTCYFDMNSWVENA